MARHEERRSAHRRDGHEDEGGLGAVRHGSRRETAGTGRHAGEARHAGTTVRADAASARHAGEASARHAPSRHEARERSSAHDRQRRSQERSDSRRDRRESARGWAFDHRRLLIALAAVLVIAWGLIGPIRGYYVARRENEDLQAYYERLSQESDSLDQDVKSLTSEDGIKDEARKRGYVGEGETSVEVDGLSEDDDSGSAERTDDRSTATKVLDTLFGYTPKDFS